MMMLACLHGGRPPTGTVDYGCELAAFRRRTQELGRCLDLEQPRDAPTRRRIRGACELDTQVH